MRRWWNTLLVYSGEAIGGFCGCFLAEVLPRLHRCTDIDMDCDIFASVWASGAIHTAMHRFYAHLTRVAVTVAFGGRDAPAPCSPCLSGQQWCSVSFSEVSVPAGGILGQERRRGSPRGHRSRPGASIGVFHFEDEAKLWLRFPVLLMVRFARGCCPGWPAVAAWEFCRCQQCSEHLRRFSGVWQ